MNITCDRTALNECATHVSRAVSPKSPLPALTGILLDAHDGMLEMVGYDMQLAMKTSIEAVVEEKGKIVVDARVFCDIIRKLPEQRVNIIVNEHNVCQIVAGKSVYNIIGINADEYPELPYVKEFKTIEIDAQLLTSMVNQTIFSVADIGSQRAVYTGLFIDIAHGKIEISALDGYRIAVRREKVDTDEKIAIIVPAKSMSELVRVIGDTEKVKISATERHVLFELDNFMLISRLLEGGFFPYEKSINNSPTTQLVIDTAEMIDTIDRISPVIIDRVNTPIHCKIEDNVFEVVATSEVGTARDECAVEQTGDSLNIGFRSNYLVEALRASDSDKVKVNFGGVLAPVNIMPVEGDSFVYIIMPVRLK